MADFGLPFMALGPLAQERSIQMLKDFYAQQNPNAPVDKVKKRKNPSVVENKDWAPFYERIKILNKQNRVEMIKILLIVG